jgi:hypothetical protein
MVVDGPGRWSDDGKRVPDAPLSTSTERTAEISTFNRSIDLGQCLLFLKFTKVFVSSDLLT